METNSRSTLPPDLEIRVRIASDSGWTRLSYALHSPAGIAPFSHREIIGPAFKGSPEELQRNLLNQIESLGDGLDVGRAIVLSPDIERKLSGIGRGLWQQLFNHEMQQAYRGFRDSVRTLLIISDEPWIPWEMVKPYNDRGDILDDEFFAERFELTRWLAGDRPAPGEIRVGAFACVEEGVGLPLAGSERRLVTSLARSQGVQDASPAEPGAAALTARLQEGGIGLLHFAGHGTFDPALPNEAGFPLADSSVFRPSDLHGPVQTQLSRDRPLVFLNACQSGRQGWSWTGLGGWADRWIRGCGCGAFLGPQWEVRDSVAFAFARSFYESLGRGETLGIAAKAARKEARMAAPGDPSWLAYAVYGYPNARVLFGRESAPIDEETSRRISESRLEVHNVTSQLGPPAKILPARSQNLRIKRQFTDRERDRFVEEAFDFIAAFFESSLTSLEQQYPQIEKGFRRVDQNRFTAAIYVDGRKESSCRVWMDRGHLGDIAYASGDSGADNTYNETLTARDDGYSLFFRPLGLRFFGSSDGKDLTQQEAAEYLWSMLIERLQ
jgi:hypothetical protein